ncbi:hypothetical protein ACIPF8_19200 [Collimonas sp. NPDC087041]|uniref:hypothetical protein n=1 Tax=Collimonas sp. NPDC087041 TaxID=3363960 RepID=UPI0037F55D61
MSDTNFHGILQLIANDAYAASFQSMGQYRTALLKAAKDAAMAAPYKSDDEIITALLSDKAKLHATLLRLPYPRAEALHLAGATDYDALRDEVLRLRATKATQPDLMPVISWLENGCDPKEAAKELRIYRDRALAPSPANPEIEMRVAFLIALRRFAFARGPELSDDDLWHIAGVVTELNGGSLFNVIQRDCVTAIRASFMNPDAGRALLASVQRADAGIPVSLVPWEEPETSAAPAPAADEVEVLKRNSDRLNFIEKNWFYRDGEGCWCFNFTESWHAGKHETFPEAIDNARGITTPAQIAEVRP